MSNKHDVTVYDRVPATARVSVEQVERYLERTGWAPDGLVDVEWRRWWSKGTTSVYVATEWIEPDEIGRIASHEGRKPSEVLADIAKELA